MLSVNISGLKWAPVINNHLRHPIIFIDQDHHVLCGEEWLPIDAVQAVLQIKLIHDNKTIQTTVFQGFNVLEL